MAAFEINKGVGRTVEFKGLKAQYLFLFAGGLLAVFILVVVLYLCGVSQITCLVIGVVGASLVVWQTFTMNRKYGQYGLMKKGAVRMHPRYLVNRRKVFDRKTKITTLETIFLLFHIKNYLINSSTS